MRLGDVFNCVLQGFCLVEGLVAGFFNNTTPATVSSVRHRVFHQNATAQQTPMVSISEFSGSKETGGHCHILCQRSSHAALLSFTGIHPSQTRQYMLFSIHATG
jgi:hypothetical protein